MNDLAAQLRRRIEDRHQKAIAALAELEAYLDDPSLLSNQVATERPSTRQPAVIERSVAHAINPTQAIGAESFRSRVLDIISTEWATVQDIVGRTGLTIRQVRGVLNAPGLSDKIQRRSTGQNQNEYHFGPSEASGVASENQKREDGGAGQ